MVLKPESDIKNILLSYPRCGKNFLTYCINIVTGCKYDSFSKHTKDSIITVTHQTHDLVRIQNKELPLILLLRNYKECIMRHGFGIAGGAKFPNGQCSQGNYWNNVVSFNGWGDNKHVIYYEDLMIEPEKIIKKLCKFIGHPNANFKELFNNFEHHRFESIKKYEQKTSPSKTKGDADKLIFHSKSKTKKSLIKIDKQLRDRNPKIYDKYLSRYKEK